MELYYCPIRLGRSTDEREQCNVRSTDDSLRSRKQCNVFISKPAKPTGPTATDDNERDRRSEGYFLRNPEVPSRRALEFLNLSGQGFSLGKSK